MRLSAAKAGNVSRLDGVDISIIKAVILFTSGRYKIPCTYPALVGGNRPGLSNPQLVADNQGVLIEAYNNYATAKHGTAVVHVWPNIMIALRELQGIIVQIFDDLLQRITSFAFRVPSFELVSSPSLPSEG